MGAEHANHLAPYIQTKNQRYRMEGEKFSCGHIFVSNREVCPICSANKSSTLVGEPKIDLQAELANWAKALAFLNGSS